MKTTTPRNPLRKAAPSLASQSQMVHLRTAVLLRIHMAMAGIEANRLSGVHDKWSSQKSMDADYEGLSQARLEILGGSDLATTSNPRLFAMRELVLAGIGHILTDGSYVLCERGAWLRVGPVSLRIEHDAKGNCVTVQCEKQPGIGKRQVMHVDLDVVSKPELTT